MRCIPIVITLALLTGCSVEYEAISAAVASQAARGADNTLRGMEWAWCRTPTSGAEKRRYGAIKPLWNARMRICWPELAE